MSDQSEKTKILNVAIELFYEQGVIDTTLVKIAYKAGIDKKELQECFKTKDEMINAYIKHHFDQTLSNIEYLMPRDVTNKEKLLFIVEFFMSSITENPKVLYMLVEFIRLMSNKKNEEALELKLYYYERCQTLLDRYIREGMDVGEFTPGNPKTVSFEIISRLLGDLMLVSTDTSKERSALAAISGILDNIKYKMFDVHG